METTPRWTPPEVSVVIPVYNEEDSLEPLRAELIPVLDGLGLPFEVVFVDDGSRDRSAAMLREFIDADHRLRMVRFTRNHGQQLANTAGLRAARGRIIIIMDADLQTPAHNIPAFIEKLREGYDIIYGVRERVKAPFYRKWGTRFANWLIRRLTGFEIPDSASGFLALDRTLVGNVNRYNDRSRYLSGLFAWLSYGRYGFIPVSRRERQFGESKYTLRSLVRLVVNFVTLFSTRPLWLSFFAAAAAAVAAVALGAAAVWQGAAGHGDGFEAAMAGSLLVALGALQLFCIGVFGVYVGRVYGDTRENPDYVVLAIHERGGLPA